MTSSKATYGVRVRRLFNTLTEGSAFTFLGHTIASRLPKFLSLLGLEQQLVSLSIRGIAHPVVARAGSTDFVVLEQIFAEQEYEAICDLNDPKLIIDCGANVGYSTVYFLNRFPNAFVIAVEPDPGNFSVLEKNTAPYGDRVRLVNSGVWSRKTGLVVVRGDYGDGREWSYQVRACEATETPDLQAVDLTTLLHDSGFTEIDLLKMDVERAETVIFSESYESWLSRTKNIVIELHDRACEEIFFKALDSYEYELVVLGERTICKGLTSKTSSSIRT